MTAFCPVWDKKLSLRAKVESAQLSAGVPQCFYAPLPGRFSQITLQRHFESFPFFEFFKAAFTMGLIGLVVALLMIVHAFQNVGRFPLRIRQTPFD